LKQRPIELKCWLKGGVDPERLASARAHNRHRRLTMSPSKKRVKNIKVHVPRHNSQRIGPALTAQIETLAKEKRVRTDVRQPTNEATSTIALAIVCPHSTSISLVLIITLGKCFRVELVATYRPCRARPTVGHGYTTVCRHTKASLCMIELESFS
jgi:hypothetical protein